ncbi:YceD family protein [Paenirhodobacter sp.]|uniref:YceD family protein n=1 Tax=Paenirhodobacter sp. TaxID=1965326 RepID=UPI003B3D0698
MTEPDTPLPWRHPVKIAELAARKPTRFDLIPDAETRACIAEWAGITALATLRLKGELTPKGRHDWLLTAALTARVEQPCVITLTPVVTDLSETVERRYLADMPEPEGDEIEMPEDDSAEPLPATIDLAAVALEALELALPLYPRAEGAEFSDTTVTEPGAAPITDEDVKPFANLRSLMEARKPDA